MGDLSENFSLKEFNVAGAANPIVSPILVNALQSLRNMAGLPIRVLSGYRTIEHNKSVGGVDGSYHTKGMAADITIGDLDIFEMYLLADQVHEFTNGGIGLYPDFRNIHVDVRGHWSRWAKVGGVFVPIDRAVVRVK